MLKTYGIALAISGIFVAPLGETLRSTSLAKDLADALTRRKLDAVAAAVPDEPDRFVAALFPSRAQLLVFSARYASPSTLQARLSHKQYRDVYLDLQSAPIPGSNVFFQDMMADGLCSGRDQVPDLLWDGNAVQTVFDGDWKKHDLSEREYTTLLAAADERYSRLLEVLLTALQGT